VAVTPRTLQLLRNLRTTIGRQADSTVRMLTAAWVKAWQQLTPAWQEAIAELVDLAIRLGRWPTPVEIARNPRIQQAVDATATELGALATQATTATVAGSTAAITTTVAAEPALIASQLPAALQAQIAAQAAALILPSALDVITARVQQAIVAQTRPLSADALDAVRRELVRGIEVGANPNDAARRMEARVQGAFEGGLSRAVNIARTEMLDAYRITSRYVHEANRDVLDGWVWMATVTGKGAARTCPSCWALHGRTFPLEEPGPLDHQQGRCARLPKVKPWSALGIDLDEPASQIPDRQTAFDALNDTAQQQVMGAARLALLRAGRITWDDLPQRRDNPSWRPSYTPRPVRDLNRIADSRP
jgi:hypothetical protein